jgi:hypothetical protein
MTWAYDEVEHLEPDILQIVKEIHGFNIVDGKYDVRSGTIVTNFTQLQADGSTACDNWIYSGMLEPDPNNPDDLTRFHNKAENRTLDEKLEDPTVRGANLARFAAIGRCWESSGAGINIATWVVVAAAPAGVSTGCNACGVIIPGKRNSAFCLTLTSPPAGPIFVTIARVT